MIIKLKKDVSEDEILEIKSILEENKMIVVENESKSEKVIESEVTIKGSEKKSTTTKKADPKKEDLSKLSLADLKAKAKDKGVKGYSTMKKADLIDALK